jgi:hypothetical protein
VTLEQLGLISRLLRPAFACWLVLDCAQAQPPASSVGGAERQAQARREIEARYAENSAAFMAKDTAAIYRLRAADFHTETPDGRTHSFADMRAYTRRLLGMIERFDTVTFRVDSLTLRGDTAVAIAYQRTDRLQHLPGTPPDERHRVTATVIQREQWVRGESGWLLWRVDQVNDQGLWIDGVLTPRRNR